MNLILILLIILLIILIFINYKKILKKDQNINLKKVRWGKKNIIMNHDLNPEFDFFDQYNNGIEGGALYKENINSNVTKYLDKMSNSYGSIVYQTNPQIANIPENPEYIKDIDNISAHEIINNNDANERILEYKEEPKIYESMEVGNIYDNLVDNYRVKWGKINGLNAYNTNNNYELENDPTELGYTDFPTY